MCLSRRLKLVPLFFLGLLVDQLCGARIDWSPNQRWIGEVLPLTNWTISGPFYPDEDSDDSAACIDWIGSDQLAWTGIHSDDDPREVVTQRERPALTGVSLRTAIDFYALYPIDKASSPKPCFEAEAEISCDRNADAYILASSDGLIDVTVNDMHVLSTERRRSIYTTYQVIAPVRLQVGRNILKVRVRRPTGSCGLQVLLCGNETVAIQQMLAADNALVKTLVVPSGGLPEMALEFIPEAYRSGVSIAPLYTSVEYGVSTAGAFLKDGLYRATLIFGEREYSEAFLVGSAKALIAEIAGLIEQHGVDESGSLDLSLSAVRERLRILDSVAPQQGSDRDWQKRAIFLVENMISLLDEARSGHRQSQGMHLRAFRSAIDGGVRHYRIYLPQRYHSSGASIPIAIMLPTALSAARPFLGSVFMSKQLEADRMSRLAEQHGVALLWCGYPSQPYGNPIERRHVDEVLADVRSSLNVDFSRVYLLGTCRAAASAFLFADQLTHNVAAIGLLNPIVNRKRNGSDDEGEYEEMPAYKQWVFRHDPLGRLYRFSNIPVHIVYDGAAPGHGTLQEATTIRDEALRRGVSTSFCKAPSTQNHLAGWASVLENVKKDISTPVILPKAGPAECIEAGSLSEVLSRPFLFVRGTNGSREDAAAMDRLAESVCKNWENVHFTKPRIVLDSEVTSKLADEFALVLLGNPETNKVWRKELLPIDLRAGTFEGEQTFPPGSQVVAVFKSTKKRPIAIIGANDLPGMNIGTLNLTTHGWFKLAAWEKCNAAGKPQFTAAIAP